VLLVAGGSINLSWLFRTEAVGNVSTGVRWVTSLKVGGSQLSSKKMVLIQSNRN